MRKYSPREYLMIDMANQYGHGIDKKTFRQRVAWARSLKDPKSKVEKAKKPYQYMAAVLAIEDVDAGRPIGHLVGLDASASGISLMGAMMGCRTTAKNCGIIDNRPSDIYKVLTDTVNELIEDSIDVPREDAKRSLMTFYYGSEAVPKEIFGEGDDLSAFYEAADIVAPGAGILRDYLLASWQPGALSHSWDMPDGFHVHIPVLVKEQSKIEIDELEGHPSIQYAYDINEGTESGLSLIANATHSVDGFIVREITRRCSYDMRKLVSIHSVLKNRKKTSPVAVTDIEKLYRKSGMMSLVAIERLTLPLVSLFTESFCAALQELVEDVLEYPPFELIQVHDEFKAHPNHVNRMREVYIGILGEIADADMAKHIIAQIRNDDTFTIEKLSHDLGDMIREGEYSIS